MTVLSISNVGKAYRIYRSEWHRFAGWFGLRFRPKEEHWVLKHINLNLSSGEAVGLIGENGAGKSTLLKLITGTLQPSEGTIAVNGRIAAILELGMGFNAELSGRENARHAAGLMGFSTQEIESALPYIEEFAEIGEYFDQPVRTYSSGMQMRVAFAVATAWRPDVLIVDEALSVGDAYFQHKSFDRIREFNLLGTALLIVSHDKSAIQSICNRAILLDHGELRSEGDPEKVFDLYNTILTNHQNQEVKELVASDGRHLMVSGTGEAIFETIRLFSEDGDPLDVVRVGQSVKIELVVRIVSPIETLVLGCGIKDRLGQMMFGTNTYHTGQRLENLKAGQTQVFTMHFDANLGPGSYSVHASLVSDDTHLNNNFQWVDRALIFEVINTDKPLFVGCCWNPLKFQIESLHGN